MVISEHSKDRIIMGFMTMNFIRYIPYSLEGDMLRIFQFSIYYYLWEITNTQSSKSWHHFCLGREQQEEWAYVFTWIADVLRVKCHAHWVHAYCFWMLSMVERDSILSMSNWYVIMYTAMHKPRSRSWQQWQCLHYSTVCFIIYIWALKWWVNVQ